MKPSDSTINEKLEALRDSFDTTKLLDVVNDLPMELRDDVLDLHSLAMQVVNYDNNQKAAEFFAKADDLSYELCNVIEKFEQLQRLVDSITEHDPGLDEDEEE